MEKRFAIFVILSTLVLAGHLALQAWLAPPRPPADQGAAAQLAADAGQDREAEFAADETADEAGVDRATAEAATVATEKPEGGEGKAGEGASAGVGSAVAAAIPAPEAKPTGAEEESPRESPPQQLVSLGSLAPNSPYRLLVTLDNQGAAVNRIEFATRDSSGQFRYRELESEAGYLGHLALRDEPGRRGCRVHTVGPGTPAALAASTEAGGEPGLRVGDLLLRAAGRDLGSTRDLEDVLADSRPGESLDVDLVRAEAGSSRELSYRVELTREPLSLIRPEVNPRVDGGGIDPASFLLTLESLAGSGVERGSDEIQGLPSLRGGTWQVRLLEDEGEGPAVEFSFPLSARELAAAGARGSMEIVKRYRLARLTDETQEDPRFPAYHLTLELEFRNTGDERLQFAYRLDGPNGLPTEGWWYNNKIHPKWGSAGSRDIVWMSPAAGHRLVSTASIYEEAREAEEKNQAPLSPLFDDTQPQPIDYVGVDTQYFAVVMQPETAAEGGLPTFRQASALPPGPLVERRKTEIKLTNVTCRLTSGLRSLAPGEVHREQYRVFAGPKELGLLQVYGLERFIEYGWFKWIAIFLAWVLHLFEKLPLVNYGLAIILLTVLVRSCMTPLSRKAARNAQMMQELAPEMKAIAEKYKSDMEKRGQAQRELFARHNYNPFGGCLLMFLQLPIFVGLYRALSTDIELRQAPLIPGLSWCSNLAGPDMLWHWQPHLPGFLASFLADPGNGWLGPYFNLLPILTIVLFLVQQKLFMPPATDEQTKMQQQMMTFMMVFMGVLFFKVPSGLCVYFIASSLWGIAERKLLPPVGKPSAAAAVVPAARDGKQGGSLLSRLTGADNAPGRTPAERRKHRDRRRGT